MLSIWVVSQEAPTTEMVSLQSSLVSIKILVSKSSDADQSRAPRETTEKKKIHNWRGFWPESGADLAWKKGLKNIGAIS